MNDIEFYRENRNAHPALMSAEDKKRVSLFIDKSLSQGESIELLKDLPAGVYSGRKFIEALDLFHGSGWFGESFCMVSGGRGRVRVYNEKYHESIPDFARRSKFAPEWAKKGE